MLFSKFLKADSKNKKRTFSNTQGSVINLASVALALSGVLAASIVIAAVELGRGVGTRESCVDGIQIAFDHSTETSFDTTITGFTLTGITGGCEGQYLLVRVLGDQETILDELVWLIGANETTLDTSANPINGGIQSSAVFGVEYKLSDQVITPIP